MKNLFIDIETIPREDATIPEFDPSSVAVGNLKDEAKIRDKIEKAREEHLEGVTKTMSLSGDLCRLVSIGGVVTDENFKVIHEEVCLGMESDAELIAKFAEWFKGCDRLWGWNSKWFDLPVIWKRSVMLGNPCFAPTEYLDLTSRYSTMKHVDLKHLWFGFETKKGENLKMACESIGIKAKDGMDGSMIFDAFKQGRYDEITKYNLQDCLVCVDLARRMFKGNARTGVVEAF